MIILRSGKRFGKAREISKISKEYWLQCIKHTQCTYLNMDEFSELTKQNKNPTLFGLAYTAVQQKFGGSIASNTPHKSTQQNQTIHSRRFNCKELMIYHTACLFWMNTVLLCLRQRGIRRGRLQKKLSCLRSHECVKLSYNKDMCLF